MKHSNEQDKHVVRFYFWRNRYDRAEHGHTSFEGDVLDWEDREFESFGDAMSFCRVLDAHWIKIMNVHGHVIYNSHDRDAHLSYA